MTQILIVCSVEKGMLITDGIWCGGLMYADDIVLLAETGDE